MINTSYRKMKTQFTKEFDENGPYYTCRIHHKLYGDALGFGITKLSAILDTIRVFEIAWGFNLYIKGKSISSIFNYIENPYVPSPIE